MPHSSRVGSQITGCSNLYPLNAPQRVSEIWLLVFTVSCFTVNKRAHKEREGCFRRLAGSFAIEMAFPAQRQTQKEFLEYYNTLKDDDEEKGIDLSHENKDEDEDEDEDEGETGLLDDLLDDQTRDKNDKSHKELDAERRAAEERAMEEVARRFESRGAQAQALEEEEEDYSEVDQIKAKMRAEAREAQRKEEAANAARVAAEREKEAKRLAEQSKALSALYDLYAEDDEERVEMRSAPCTTDVPKVPLPRPPPPSLASIPAASSTPAASAASSAPTAGPNKPPPPAKRLKVGSSSTGADLLDSIMGGMDRTMSVQQRKKKL